MWTGVDIGHSTIKVVQVVRSWNGFRLVGIARLSNVLPPENPKDSATIRRYIRLQLQRVFAENKLLPSKCVIGVSGKDVNLRIIQMPPIKSPVRFNKMMGYELMQLSGKSGENLYSDFCRLHVTNKSYPEIPILVGMAKGTFVDEETRILTKIGLEVDDICPNSIALSYALRESEIVKPNETVMLADFGATNSEIVILQGKNLIFARNISAGGERLTEAIQSRLNISREEAESLKVASGRITPRETESSSQDRLLQESLRSGAGQFESAIESGISFALAQLKIEQLSPDRVFISGGSAKLKGLAGYLGEGLNKPVEVFEPFRNIKLGGVSAEARERISESACDFSVALGLALTGAAHNKSTVISFLPPERKSKQEFYHSTLPLMAAGVLFLIGMIIWVLSAYTQQAKESGLIKDLKSESDQFTATQAKFAAIQTKEKTINTDYLKLDKITQATDFVELVIKLVSQELLSEAWIVQASLNYAPRGSTPQAKPDPDAKEIMLNGYLEDDSPETMEGLKNFVERLNRSNDYLPIEATLNKLDTPKTPNRYGKKEFEISIKIKN